MALILPESLRKESPQYTGEHDGSMVVVVYDDKASTNSEVNEYAVFSKKGFHGWLGLGYTMSELLFALSIEPGEAYEIELEHFIKRNKS